MSKKIKDPGLGEQSSEFAQSIMNSDGSFNVNRVNKRTNILDTYHYLINITWTRFFLLAIVAFTAVNVLFALIYLLIGVDQIMVPTNSVLENFITALFFSAQTLTTLGYGFLAPNGMLSGFISSFEAFLGLSMFAFLTGLIYGRFSKPKASIRFSENLIFRDFNTTKAIMFRLVNNRSNVMIKPKATVTLALSKLNNKNEYKRSFYNLKLEREQINYLPTTWTIVHEIDQDSPLIEYKNEELNLLNAELVVMITYFDQSFNQEVHQIHSYNFKDLKLNYKFNPAFYYDKDGKLILDFDKIDSITPYKS